MKIPRQFLLLVRNFFIFSGLVLFSTLTSGAEPEKTIWQGKIGKNSVIFCFAQPSSGRMPGWIVGYYYVLPAGNTKYLKLDNNGQYFEGDPDEKIATWQLAEVMDKKITGHKLVGNKKERIDLSRLKTKPKKPANKNQYVGENEGCDDAFNQPRVTRLLEKIKIEDKLFADKHYQVMVLKNKYTNLENQLVILPETFANAEQYQQKVKKQIEGTLYYRLDLVDGYNPSDETIKESIIYWDKNWLTIRHVGDEYSGGAHPNFWQDFKTYNLQNGKEENLWDWFKNVKVETTNISDGTALKSYHPSKEFRKLVDKFDNYTVCKKVFIEDGDHDDIAYSVCVETKTKLVAESNLSATESCEECIESNRLSFGLHPEGLVVREHLDFGSGSGSYNNLIPYAKLMPYLNKKGREYIEQIMLNQSAGM